MLRAALFCCLLAGVSTLSVRAVFDGGHAPPAGPPPAQVTVTLQTDQPVAEVEARFLSVAIDTAQVVGGEFWAPPGSGEGLLRTQAVDRYDFSRPRLRELARGLAPAYLRIGGTAADWTVYQMDGDAPARTPRGARWTLTRARWDEVNAFARDVDFHLMFTLNAGESARDADGAWDPESARGLIRYSQQQGYPVDVWELGNETNAFPVLHWTWLSAGRYAGDVGRARALLDGLHAPARLAGLATAFWPVMGEWRSFTDAVLERAGHDLDIVTWHYYPEQSDRCPIATRRAHAGVLPAAGELADVERWAGLVETAAHAHAPQAAVWLGETASAQCGGEQGLSNSFADALWWLDELGRVARRGQRVVVRQTLSGADYGLIDDQTLQPNPSYWASWLWRRFMGRRVLALATTPTAAAVRTYAHCLTDASGGVAVLLENLDASHPVAANLPGALGPAAHTWRLTADGLASRTVKLEGEALHVGPDGQLPALATGVAVAVGAVQLPPLSATFVIFPNASLAACGETTTALR